MKKFFLTLAFLCASHSLAPVFAQEYKMAGPYEVVARDGEFRKSKGGSERDMKAAWDFAKEGKHDEALRIINAYTEKLQRVDGHDAPLCLIQGYWLCRAMIIEKEQKTPAWETMLRRAMVPTMNKFEADSPYANDNWAGSPMGEYKYGDDIQPADLWQFRPALARMLQWMKEHYASSDIYFILNDILKDDINTSVRTLCNRYGIKLIELKDIDKISGHPSVKGMQQIADQVVSNMEQP